MQLFFLCLIAGGCVSVIEALPEGSVRKCVQFDTSRHSFWFDGVSVTDFSLLDKFLNQGKGKEVRCDRDFRYMHPVVSGNRVSIWSQDVPSAIEMHRIDYLMKNAIANDWEWHWFHHHPAVNTVVACLYGVVMVLTKFTFDTKR